MHRTVLRPESVEGFVDIPDAPPRALERANANEKAFDPIIVRRVPNRREDVVKRGLRTGERIVLRTIRESLENAKLPDHGLV
jgi:hypothetical protein